MLPSFQTGQVLAITLLNNANLDDNILTNAKMQLISLAETKASKEAEMKESKKEIVIPANSFDEAVSLANEVKDASSMSPYVDHNGRRMVTKNFIKNFREKAVSACTALEELKSDVTEDKSDGPTLEEMFREKGAVIKLDPDDAVTVLRNIFQTPSKDTCAMAEFNFMFHEHLTAYLTNNNLRARNTLADAPPLGAGGSGGSGGNKKRKKKGNGGNSGGGGGGTKRHAPHGRN